MIAEPAYRDCMDVPVPLILCQTEACCQFPALPQQSQLALTAHYSTAAKAAGVHKLQRLHWDGHHITGRTASMDHDAILHAAKYL